MNMPLYCINLSSRSDRWESMIKKFDGMTLIRCPAIRHRYGWKGLIYSNKMVLENIINNEEPIIVLEDDCKLLDSIDVFKKRFIKYMEYLKEHEGEWDFFSGGGIYVKPKRIVSTDPFIIECEWSVCTQFIIHSKKSANEVIKWAGNPKEWKCSIDTYMAKTFKKIWLPYPMFCIQEIGDSDINRKLNYKKKIDDGFVESIKILDEFVKKNV